MAQTRRFIYVSQVRNLILQIYITKGEKAPEIISYGLLRADTL